MKYTKNDDTFNSRKLVKITSLLPATLIQNFFFRLEFMALTKFLPGTTRALCSLSLGEVRPYLVAKLMANS